METLHWHDVDVVVMEAVMEVVKPPGDQAVAPGNNWSWKER